MGPRRRAHEAEGGGVKRPDYGDAAPGDLARALMRPRNARRTEPGATERETDSGERPERDSNPRSIRAEDLP